MKNSSLNRDLESLRVRISCPKPWTEMKGGDEKRFCEHCQLHVHNLSALSPREIKTLAQTPGRRCVAYFTDPLGGVRRPSRFSRLVKILPPTRRLIASLAALLFPLSFIACDPKSQGKTSPLLGESNPPQPPAAQSIPAVENTPEMLIGDVIDPPRPAQALPEPIKPPEATQIPTGLPVQPMILGIVIKQD